MAGMTIVAALGLLGAAGVWSSPSRAQAVFGLA